MPAKRRALRIAVVVAAVALGAVLAFQVGFDYFLSRSVTQTVTCTDQQAAALAQDPVMTATPPDSTFLGVNSFCNDPMDGGYPAALGGVRTTNSPSAVQAFYREQAAAHGWSWTARPPNGLVTSMACLTKKIDGHFWEIEINGVRTAATKVAGDPWELTLDARQDSTTQDSCVGRAG